MAASPSERALEKDVRGPLRFTRLHVENWKNFIKAESVLQERLFLVGPNASGKSNYLDIFRFLHEIVAIGGGFQAAVAKRGGVSKIRSLAARRYPDIVIDVSIGSAEQTVWRYELHFKQDNRQRPIISRERVTHLGTEILNRPTPEDARDVERLTQTFLEQVNVNRNFRDVVNFFSTIHYLHLVPQLVREPERSVGRSNDPFGGDFLEQVAHTPEKVRNARLRRIREALRVAVPQLKDLQLDRDAKGKPHLRGKYEHWRARGAWQTEEQFSDGTLRLVGLLWALQEGSGPLLLEEPELSLHPEVVRHTPTIFASVQRRTGKQILVSTHSPEILRDETVGLDEVLLLNPEKEGTQLIQASDLPRIKELLAAGLSLADIIIPHTRPDRVRQLTLVDFFGG